MRGIAKVAREELERLRAPWERRSPDWGREFVDQNIAIWSRMSGAESGEHCPHASASAQAMLRNCGARAITGTERIEPERHRHRRL